MRLGSIVATTEVRPSPACGGGLGWGWCRNGHSLCGESPHPALRADLPRKRERLSEPAAQPIPLIDRNIRLARDPGPARGLRPHHLAELLRRHGLRLGALIGKERGEFG